MKHSMHRSLACLVLVVLLAAAALNLTGCQSAPAPETQAVTDTQAVTATMAAPETQAATQADTQALETEAETIPTQVGEGDKLFYFEVTGESGETSSYAVHTDADTVGQALVELEMISGTDSEYGLMVDTVLGEKQDYNEDGMYWAFYENGEYAMNGVDSTQIVEGATYAFVATPA